MDERSARTANLFPEPMLPIPRGESDQLPDTEPLTFLGLWRYALGGR